MKKLIGVVAGSGFLVFAIAQFIHPPIPKSVTTVRLNAPPEIQSLLEKDCYSCHSNQSRLSWFDQAEPAYWLVRKDVLTAREHLNFSTLGEQPAAVQNAALYEAVAMIQLGAMPLPRFTALHPEAKVTPEELATLKSYLAPWSSPPPVADHSTTDARELKAILSAVSPSPNGLAFDPSFKTWRVLDTTDRGDNNQFRMILGNNIAVVAARAGKVSPWPDGTRFAKIAWFQEREDVGLISPGKFWQIELMVKDAKRYASTDGWGWGRWRGLELKPYGKDTDVVNECTGCHSPVHGNDYVYTLPISPATVRGNEVVNANAARLPPELHFRPLDWTPITMYVDRGTHTTATLFANDIAALAARAYSGSQPYVSYPIRSKLALVTWTQRDDPHWFGARILDVPVSVELVDLSTASKRPLYTKYLVHSPSGPAAAVPLAPRADFILQLRPAAMP